MAMAGEENGSPPSGVNLAGAAMIGFVAVATLVSSGPWSWWLVPVFVLATGIVPRAGALETWLTWWVGDTFGAMICTPIALTLIGRPRADWAARRAIVGLTLALVTLVMALGIAQVVRWDAERLRNAFNRDASLAATVLDTRLREPLMAIEAMRGAKIGTQIQSRQQQSIADAGALGVEHPARQARQPVFQPQPLDPGQVEHRLARLRRLQLPHQQVQRLLQVEVGADRDQVLDHSGVVCHDGVVDRGVLLVVPAVDPGSEGRLVVEYFGRELEQVQSLILADENRKGVFANVFYLGDVSVRAD